MWAQARQGKTLPWVLRLDDHPAIIGQCTVSNIVYGSVQSGSIGYWIDHNHAGRSLMPLAVALATDYAMTVVGLHRIEVCIRPENAASLRVMDKLGFRYEGRREKYIHINGHWCDHDVFVLTADEVGEGVVSRLS
jgi:ribosomal-protein-alanine N-acetyltransferase